MAIKSAPNFPETIKSPFGATARLRQVLETKELTYAYKIKCGADISSAFSNIPYIAKYECTETGYTFWRPEAATGNQEFYSKISAAWKDYYRLDRWEYPYVRKLLSKNDKLLEVGCGKGHFLRSIEQIVNSATGLELNEEAAANKATTFPVLTKRIEELLNDEDKYDVVCAFHVLEHAPNPKQFIESAAAITKDNGLLIFTTPNHDYIHFSMQKDAFDMPPHHMGHFNPVVFGRIAKKMGLHLVETVVQKRRYEPPTASATTQNSLAFRIARLTAKLTYNIAYSLTKEPGETVLAIYRK